MKEHECVIVNKTRDDASSSWQHKLGEEDEGGVGDASLDLEGSDYASSSSSTLRGQGCFLLS